jgi:hypothetical protein
MKGNGGSEAQQRWNAWEGRKSCGQSGALASKVERRAIGSAMMQASKAEKVEKRSWQ